MNEKIKKMLEKQLELLSERAKICEDENLLNITQAMCMLVECLNQYGVY